MARIHDPQGGKDRFLVGSSYVRCSSFVKQPIRCVTAIYPRRFTSLARRKYDLMSLVGISGIRRRLRAPPSSNPVQSRIAVYWHDAVALAVILTAASRSGVGRKESKFPITKRRVVACPLAPADGDCRAHILHQLQRQRDGRRHRAQGMRSVPAVRVATGGQKGRQGGLAGSNRTTRIICPFNFC